MANNTAVDCNHFLRVWDEKVRSRGVRMCNNLSLGARHPDTLAFDSGGNPSTSRGLGDGTVPLLIVSAMAVLATVLAVRRSRL